MTLCKTLKATLTALALTAPALTATAALAQDYADYGTTKGWAVMSVSAEGSFLRCEAMTDRLVFMITLSREGWMVTIDSLPGAPAEVAGFIDIDRASFEAVYHALDDGRYGAFLEPGAVEALRQGSFMVLDAGGQITEGALDGSAAAMGKLTECVENAGMAPTRTGAADPGRKPQPTERDADRMDATCPDPRDYASVPSEEAAVIEFVNLSDVAITAYWIDFDGVLQDHAATLPGETIEVVTFVGHSWLAKDFNGTCHSDAVYAAPGTTRVEMY